jgi:hypothetical protein
VANPTKLVVLPEQADEAPATYTNDELRRMLEAIETAPEDVCLNAFIWTGMRRFEVLQVRLEEIDWASNCIPVLGKGRPRKLRLVPIHPTLRQALIRVVARARPGQVHLMHMSHNTSAADVSVTYEIENGGTHGNSATNTEVTDIGAAQTVIASDDAGSPDGVAPGRQSRRALRTSRAWTPRRCSWLGGAPVVPRAANGEPSLASGLAVRGRQAMHLDGDRHAQHATRHQAMMPVIQEQPSGQVDNQDRRDAGG